MQDKTPPADALKRAISVLNTEAMRLREKAARWNGTSDAVERHVQIMQQDAAELDAVRAYLEQFVTRVNDRTPARCPKCGRIGMDDCELSSCTWEQWSDGTPVTPEQKAAGAAWADGMNAWLAKREAGGGR